MIQYRSGGFYPDYQELPIYKLVSLYGEMRKEGLDLGLDPIHHPVYTHFSSIDDAFGKCERIYSSIVARKEIYQEIEENHLFEPPIQKISQPAKVQRMKIPENAILTLLVVENPKRGKSAERFSLYRSGMTVGEYIGLVGNPTLAINDILWDSKRNWIRYEVSSEQENAA